MRYFISTFGCQMNKSDSERIARVLQNLGGKDVSSIKQADLIVINMCSVRQSAVDRAYGLIRQLTNNLKNKNRKIILTGCILQKDKEKLKGKVDLIFNIEDLPGLPSLLNKPTEKVLRRKIHYLSLPPLLKSCFSAYVPIMTGCNNFCTYCVVPYTREREISRPASEIIKEIECLHKKGYKEIILLGQNVNSYRDGKTDFPVLLEKINSLKGKFWLRFITSHPKDLSDRLIEVMAQGGKITEYLHLPMQSGDEKILKKMNRGYTIEYYSNLIRKIREKIPGLNVSTDIIVGFPGETNKQFKNTAEAMKKIGFDMAYIARYSPRRDTSAAHLMDTVTNEEKKEREKYLTEILKITALKNNEKYLDRMVEVLVEQNKKNVSWGKTRSFKNVKIDHPFPPGRFVKVKIVKVIPWRLEGLPWKPS